MAHVDVNELDPEKTVVVATGNPHKVTEIEAILAPVLPGTRFVALGELGDFEDPVEDGDTFEANALIKARAALAEVGLDSVADDSGLVVDALGGAPGILSARWAGTHGDDAANNEKLLGELADVDVVALLIDATKPVGRGDEWVAKHVAAAHAYKLLVVTKADIATPEQVKSQLDAASQLADFDDSIVVSATEKFNVDAFLRVVSACLPEGPKWFPEDMETDATDEAHPTSV